MTMRAVAKSQANASAIRVRKVEFDYLRAFVIVLVLFVHAVLAYTTAAFTNFENPIASSNPVVNEQRWIGFDLVVALGDTFSMPLLFLLSGLFVWRSLERKGAWRYFSDRLKRLGLPFVIGVLFLVPLAYYPAQLGVELTTEKGTRYGAFWVGMVRSGFGTAGPLWFLWLLLAFDCLSTFFYRIAPLLKGFVSDRLDNVLCRPVPFTGVLLAISMIAYLPIAVTCGPLRWVGIGPFHAQASRVLLYLVYFLAGIAAGGIGVERSVFRADGPLAKRWWAWIAVGQMSFAVFVVLLAVVAPMQRTIISEMVFAVCCWANVLGVIGLFLRFVRRRVRILDRLSENSYGIYIVHYVFVTWLQYLLLKSAFIPLVKGVRVFVGALVLGWVLVALVRRVPAITKII